MKKEKNRAKRNLIGAAVMTGLILLAMPLGVGRSLEELRDEAQGEYYYDAAGYAIWEGIDKRQEAAKNLLTVASRYQETAPQLSAYIEELDYRVRASENAYSEGSAQEVSTNMEMGIAAEQLSAALEKVELSDKDKKYPAQLIAQMQSEQDKIQRSSYNDAARGFNSRLYSFPANVLRHFTDVKELAAFDEPGVVEMVVEAEYSGNEAEVVEGTAETAEVFEENDE